MGFKLNLCQRPRAAGTARAKAVRPICRGGFPVMVMMAAVPQACCDEGPCCVGHEHERDKADEREHCLALLHAALPFPLGGAFGEAGGFFW